VALTGPVLAAVDPGPDAGEILVQARALADGLRAALVVVHVLPDTSRVRMLFPQWAAADAAARLARESEIAAALRAQVEAATGRDAADVAIALDAGSPHAGILARADAAGAGVIVVGPGPVAGRVARYAAVPVVVARPSPRGAVLGATDFSDPATPAIEAAATEAARRGSALRVIHCLDFDRPLGVSSVEVGVPPDLPQTVLDELERHSREELRATLATRGVAGECIVARGLAALCIVDAARAVPTELIVVGTRGRTSLPRVLMGSVAEAVVAAAPCSVLVVPLRPGPAAP
jgi:nucleotide-binding universal stress UspA family protein